MAEQTVELFAGESKVVSFEVIPKVARTYQVAVDGLSGSFTAVEPLKYGDLRGRVYDMVTMEPLQGATVSIAGQTAYTTSAGEYTVPTLRVGTYSATFSKEGYESTVYLDNLVIKEGDNVVNVGLVRLPTETGSLSGIVRDSVNRAPIPDVKVTLTGYIAVGEPPYQSTQQVYYETYTDTEGRYSFTNVLTLDYSVSFIKESYETVAVAIDLQWEAKTLDIDLVWTGAGLRLMFTNPKKAAVVWDARVYDIATGGWIGGTPGGIKELHIPCDFDINFVTFLLQVMELPRAPEPGPYWFGPYLVTIPALGTYTWNSRAGRINGIKALDMPHATNESQVTGVITGYDWISEGRWGVSLTIEETQGGEGDFAQFFDSIYIRDASIPLDSLGAPVISAGKPVNCKVSMVWEGYTHGWKARDFYLVGDYPPEAYAFSGGLSSRDYKINVWDIDYYHDISFNVRGGIPPFRVVLVQFTVYDTVARKWTFTGPVSSVLKGINSWYKPVFCLYAHPNPSASWSQERWQAERWVRVAYMRVHWSDM